MSPNKKYKIFIVCIVVACICYSMAPQTNLDTNNSNDKNIQLHKSRQPQSDSSIFSVNFTAAGKNDNKSLEDGINYLRRVSESENANLSNDKSNIEPDSFKINFDENVVSVYIESNNTNDDDSENSLIINDGFYIRNNLMSSESVSDSIETVFVTDYVTNQLISCRENKGSYKCHIALSKLNAPQDILVINNYIYIVNSYKEGESGGVTRCNITNQGYIDSCGETRINIINPMFFYYNPPNINISDFEYSGSGRTTPRNAIQCLVDANGNFNCIPDNKTLSAFYYSKYYNNSYYRTHSNPPNSYIEKCSTVDSLSCINMPNEHLVSPLSLSINKDRIFISNAKSGNAKPEILKCSMDMKSCDVITNSIISPMCIGVFNFKQAYNEN